MTESVIPCALTSVYSVTSLPSFVWPKLRFCILIDQLPAKYLRMMDEGESAERVVADYIAGMTDQYAITKFSEYFLPQAWQVDGY